MSIYLLMLILLYTTSVGAEDLVIEDAGIGYVHDDDIAIIFYVTVRNKCKYEFEISVCMLQCCETTKADETDCNSMFLIGGSMGILYTQEAKNITLIYPNMYLANRQGICTVSVHYRNENMNRQLTRDIEFSTLPAEDQNQLCATMDLDPAKNCTPVDCVIKYSGSKSFFDHGCKECKCVPSCVSGPGKAVPDIGYSVMTNNCTQLIGSIGKEDLEVLDNNPAEHIECGAEDEMMSSSFDTYIICHHGNVNSMGKCICHLDWTTTIDEEMYQPMLMLYHMCNVEIGAWSCVNKGKIRTTALLIGIFAVTIASKIIILMCVLNWCYRHYKSKKGSDRTCADRMDPMDASLLVCEETLNAEKCICNGPAKRDKSQKPSTLRSETVNVSYYPCAVSTISSIRAGSTPKFEESAESIVLSNTNSSSAACAVRTDSEGITEESEEAEEEVDEEGEESYDIEFFGEEEDNIAVFDEQRGEELTGDGEELTGEGDELTGEGEELTGEGGTFHMAVMDEEFGEQTEYSISAEDSRTRNTGSSKTKSGSGPYSDKANE